jgi:hypothetical protein
VTVADLTRINQWLDTTLKNDLQLAQLVFRRVYSDEAPQGGAAPLVVYAFLGGADKQVTSRGRLSSVLYLIRAINEGSSYDSVEAIADRIEAILQVPDEGVIQRDVRISSCYREQPHQRKDSQYGKPTVYLGGFYRIRYQPVDV